MVEEQDLDLAAVVGVDDARAGVDEVSEELGLAIGIARVMGNRRGSLAGLTWRQGRSEGRCGRLRSEGQLEA